MVVGSFMNYFWDTPDYGDLRGGKFKFFFMKLCNQCTGISFGCVVGPIRSTVQCVDVSKNISGADCPKEIQRARRNAAYCDLAGMVFRPSEIAQLINEIIHLRPSDTCKTCMHASLEGIGDVIR